MRVLICVLLLAFATFAPHRAKAQLHCDEAVFDIYECVEDIDTSTYEWNLVSGPSSGTLDIVDINSPGWTEFKCANRNSPPGVVNGVQVQDSYHAHVRVFLPYVSPPSGTTHDDNPNCRSLPPGPQYFVDYSIYQFYAQLYASQVAYCAFFWYSSAYCATFSTALMPIYIGPG